MIFSDLIFKKFKKKTIIINLKDQRHLRAIK